MQHGQGTMTLVPSLSLLVRVVKLAGQEPNLRARELLRAVGESLGPCALQLPRLHVSGRLQACRGSEGETEQSAGLAAPAR